MAKRRYHTLLVRENDDYAPWQIHFGDYDRAVVDQEREDITESDYAKKNTKIITTASDQASIDTAVATLNAKA